MVDTRDFMNERKEIEAEAWKLAQRQTALMDRLVALQRACPHETVVYRVARTADFTIEGHKECDACGGTVA